MNCNVCDSKLKEGELICSNCGEKVALNEQKKQIEKAKEKTKIILTDVFSSKISLVYVIMLSVIAGCSLVATLNNLISKNWIILIISGISLLVSTITTINGWKLYLKKSDEPNKAINKLGGYSSFLKVMWIFGLVATCIISFVLLVLGGLVAGATDSLGDIIGDIANEISSLDPETADLVLKFEGLIKDIGIVILIVIMMVCAAFIVLVVNILKTYKNTTNFYEVVAKSYELGIYNYKDKVPVVRSYIFGSIEVLLGIFTIVSSWGFGLLLISIGGYTFISGLLFDNLHKEEIKNMELIQEEVNKYNKIDAEIKKILLEEEKKKQQEAEAKEQELRMTQQQQQIMMQQLMQQMMEKQNKKEE